MSKVKFEVVLVWSYKEPRNPDRLYRAYNRVFDAHPSDDELAEVVTDKQRDLEDLVLDTLDPQFHTLELRRVETFDLCLSDILAQIDQGNIEKG